MNANERRKLAVETLSKERNELKCEVYELEKRLRNAERILRDYGMKRCDIPACNCNSYHQETPEPEV